MSKQKNEIIVLTSDCVFRLDGTELNVIEAENQVVYGNIGVTPTGTFIFSEFSDIYKLDKSLNEMKIIESPFEMDMIEFKSWNENVLEFQCYELGKWERHEIMELDTNHWKIRTKKNAPQQRI